LCLALIALGISCLFLLLGGLLSKAYNTNREAITPLECGFNSAQDLRAPVSLRFFVFAVIFVVFDIELVLVIPVLITRISHVEVVALYFFYTCLLCGGLFVEWNNSAFD